MPRGLRLRGRAAHGDRPAECRERRCPTTLPAAHPRRCSSGSRIAETGDDGPDPAAGVTGRRTHPSSGPCRSQSLILGASLAAGHLARLALLDRRARRPLGADPRRDRRRRPLRRARSPAPATPRARADAVHRRTGRRERPVDWALAERVAARFSGHEPFADSYHYDSLAPDFAELTARPRTCVEAEHRPASPPPARPGPGSSTARPGSRPTWPRSSACCARCTEKLDDRMGGRAAGAAHPARSPAPSWAPCSAGCRPGCSASTTCWSLEDEDPDDQDLVYYVGPNVLALEKRFAFPPREFRLWLALHEVTHRAQFTGVPWLRTHFLGLVDEMLGAVRPRPASASSPRIGRVADDLRDGPQPARRRRHGDPVRPPEQRLALDQVGGPDEPARGPRRRHHGPRRRPTRSRRADRFGRVLRQRRQQSRTAWPACCSGCIGLEAKLAQYEQGEKFIAAVEDVGGPRLLDRAWERPEQPADPGRDPRPAGWLARIGRRAAA